MGGESIAGMIMMTTKSKSLKFGYALVEEGSQFDKNEA